jgi:hypothetical protein
VKLYINTVVDNYYKFKLNKGFYRFLCCRPSFCYENIKFIWLFKFATTASLNEFLVAQVLTFTPRLKFTPTNYIEAVSSKHSRRYNYDTNCKGKVFCGFFIMNRYPTASAALYIWGILSFLKSNWPTIDSATILTTLAEYGFTKILNPQFYE